MRRSENHPVEKSWLDRMLSIFADVRAGEGATAILMLANIFLLLVCYSVIKTVREPLILLGGGAEVRSYASAGQALLLMGFVPLYSWFASRVDRVKLLVGVTVFFVACVELFAMAVSARVPYVGVAFFIWVGIFNVSLVAQFWSFANDIYSKNAGERLFPIIVIGMTAGAPLGSFIAGHLFRSGITPNLILHISAVLLSLSVLVYLWINSRHDARTGVAQPAMSAADGFKLVLASPYLRLVAALVVLLNIVNTTGEYVVARLLTMHVNELAAADAAFNKQAYIGAFTGDYQFWVNVLAFLLQAFVSSRLIRYRGLRGALLALPLVALGGYAIIAAGVGLSVVRWVKTVENATDYSIMNTARQLLWLPTNRDEKYKAKQAIDAFFMRGGDLLSAVVVFTGSRILHLTVEQFAVANIAFTLVWIGVAFAILGPRKPSPRLAFRPLATSAMALGILAVAASAFAQETRQQEREALQAQKAAQLRPYEPTTLERRIERIGNLIDAKKRPVYPFVGSVLSGGGPAFGAGYTARFGDTGRLEARAARSVRNYKGAEATLHLPTLATNRVKVEMRANWLDAPDLAFYGIGNNSLKERSRRALLSVDHIRCLDARTGRTILRRRRGSRCHSDGDGSNRSEYVFHDGEPVLQSQQCIRGVRLAPVAGVYQPGRSLSRRMVRLSADQRACAQLQPARCRGATVRADPPGKFGRCSSRAGVFGERRGRTSVPVVLLPDLGGSHTLRGYPTWRFRDRNRLHLTGEYRWKAGHFVDMAVFIDAGQVASRFSDFDVRKFKKAYGVGMSLHTPIITVTRIEVARTSESTSLLFSFSPSF